MASTNLLKPTVKNISLFYTVVDETLFKDQQFIELMNILIQKQNTDKYSYAIYADSNMLKTNLFVPTFHTIYLACRHNNVILGGDDDLWVSKIFTNNSYFMLKENSNKETNYNEYNVKIISGVKELI